LPQKKSSHIGVDYFVMHLPQLPKKFLAIFVNLLVLSFIVHVIYMSTGVIKSNMTQLSQAMRIPMGYIFMAIPTGFSISFVYVAISLYAIVKSTYRSKFS